MTNEQAQALGRRWIAAGGGWREGMLSQHGERVLSLAPPTERPRLYIADPCPESRPPWDILTVRADDGGPRVPDLRDPATRGAALEVVRERWGGGSLHLSPLRSGWGLAFRDEVEVALVIVSSFPVVGATEAEALVVALEAAPVPG